MSIHTGRSRRRRSVAALTTAVLLAAALTAFGAPGPAGAQQAPKPQPPQAALAAAAGPRGQVVTLPDGGPVTFVGTPSGRSIAVTGGGTTPRSAAQAFVEQYGAAFGEADPARDLRVARTRPMGAGGESVHYQQLERGVPVLAGELNVQVGPSGKVRSAGGELSTGDPVNTTPRVSAPAAQQAAVAAVAADASVDGDILSAGNPERWVYDPSLIDEPESGRLLVWRIDVSSTVEPVHRDVLVDATNGTVVLQLERILEGRNRQVCDDQNVSGRSSTCPNAAAAVVRAEGEGASGVAEVNNAYDLSGATYDYYSTQLGRDSVDGAGLPLRSTVRHCPTGEACPYANAFWDGAQMVYGDTYAGADDVVGHELTHGVTQYESGLVYQNQSGAINESLSDVFGELIDLDHPSANPDTAANRWLMGEDLPSGAVRNMSNPPAFGDPDHMLSPNYYNGAADAGGVHRNSGVNNKAASLIVDGGTFNGQTVAGIGLLKAAKVYYEVQANLLTSGSNYQALGNALNQACANLVGTAGITAGNCTEVAKAVEATEMTGAPPANDSFANATTIPGTTGSTTGSTAFATREPGEPGHWSGTTPSPGTASIWFRFTAVSSGSATLTTCNSGFDTIMAVYTGSAVNGLIRVADNDDNGVGACSESLHSRVQFNAIAGTTYRIAVDGYGTAKGLVTLNWTVPADATDPTVSLVTPAVGATYTRGQVVTAGYSCADEAGGSGLASCVGTVAHGAAIDTATLGSKSFTVTATDNAGNDTVVTRSYTVVDGTDPTVVLETPAVGATYTRGQVVNASFSCADEAGGSGLASCVGTAANGVAIDTATLGSKSFTVTATDVAGNDMVVTRSYTVVDGTDPTVSLVTSAVGATYTRGQVVNASFSCADEAGGSGLASCVGTAANGAAIATATLGSKSFTVTATDVAGNTTVVTRSYTVVDGTDPTVSLVTPAVGATYGRNQVVNAGYSCADEAGGSGLASCVGTVANGAAINTATLGSKSFTVTATDVAGNTTVVTRSYTVVDPRPDGLVRSGAGTYRGNNVYNTTGLDQTVRASAAVGATATYTVSVQNDAAFADTLRVRSTASTTRFRVTYTVGGVDVTGRITAGTYTTVRPPGTALAIRVNVRVKPGTPAGATLAAKLTVRSTTVTTFTDTVGFTTRRR